MTVFARLMLAVPLVGAWLLLAAAPRPFLRACRAGRERTGRALVYGGVAVAALAGAARLIVSGRLLPLLLSYLYVMTLAASAVMLVVALAQSVTLVVVGSLARRAALDERPWLSALVGFLVITVGAWLPLFGGAVRLAASALGLGALALRFLEWRKGAAAGALLLLLAAPGRAGAPEPFYEMTQKQAAATLKRIHKKNPDLSARISAVSERFLSTPYVLGPLGEGQDGEYDRDPLFDLKHVDCTTFVEQVMALSVDPDLDSALNRTLQKIRYKDGNVAYKMRNHFTELDWVPHNAWAGYLRDITASIAPDMAKVATKKISKRDWYLHKSTADIQGFGDEEAEKERRLIHLQGLGEQFQDEIAALPYVPMEILPSVIDRIPSGTIGNLVRADEPDKATMVSHQVLLIRKGKDKRLFVRHAASGRFVEDVPALEYFYRYFNSKWPLLGLNLNAVAVPSKR